LLTGKLSSSYQEVIIQTDKQTYCTHGNTNKTFHITAVFLPMHRKPIRTSTQYCTIQPTSTGSHVKQQ